MSRNEAERLYEHIRGVLRVEYQSFEDRESHVDAVERAIVEMDDIRSHQSAGTDIPRLAVEALANVSGALVDSGVRVPHDETEYGQAIRELTADRDRLARELEAAKAAVEKYKTETATAWRAELAERQRADAAEKLAGELEAVLRRSRYALEHERRHDDVLLPGHRWGDRLEFLAEIDATLAHAPDGASATEHCTCKSNRRVNQIGDAMICARCSLQITHETPVADCVSLDTHNGDKK